MVVVVCLLVRAVAGARIIVVYGRPVGVAGSRSVVAGHAEDLLSLRNPRSVIDVAWIVGGVRIEVESKGRWLRLEQLQGGTCIRRS